jgi:ribosomal protein S18 acetylase RimI-like enzyme
MNSDIATIERLLLNSIPARQTILLDQWMIRLNDKFTYRANCACPIFFMDSQQLQKEIHDCERIFNYNCMPTVIKVTPDLQDNVEDILVNLNYCKIKTVNVMVCDITNYEIADYLKLVQYPNDNWLNASAKLSVIDDKYVQIHCQGIKDIAIDKVFVCAIKDNKIVGCGYGTIEHNYVGIYDLHVEEEYRKQGIGSAICDAILNYGKEKGAVKGYLAVHSLNKNAIRLYQNRGFIKSYEYYFYCKSFKDHSIVDA